MATVGFIQESDLPRLAELYAELTPDDAHPLDAMREGFLAMAEERDRYFLVGVWEEGELSGSATGIVCRQLNHDSRPLMLMENFVVAEKHRRKGFGKLLIAEIERLAAGSGCRCVLFVSGMKRTDAHAFYESAGYPKDAERGFKKRL